MSVFDSINRTIRNVFVGSHKGEDIKDEWFEKSPKNPLDDMTVANGSNKYASPERMAELEAEINPRPEEDMAEWFSDRKEKPDESDEIEEEKTLHQKMYEIATSKYNPFGLGGSEERIEEFTPENDPFGGY